MVVLGAATVTVWLGRAGPSTSPPVPPTRAPPPILPTVEPLPPPGPRPPADLGAPEPLRIARDGLPPVTGRLWAADRPGAPLILVLPQAEPDAEAAWLPAVRALRAQRPVSLAVLDPVPPAHGDWSAPATWHGLLDDLRQWLDPAVTTLATEPRFADASISLAGSGLAAVALLSHAAVDPRVRCVVAVAPSTEPSVRADLTTAYSELTRRQILLAWSDTDPTAPEGERLATPLTNARRLHAAGEPGRDRVLPATLAPDLTGWWFAALGPKR